jgi:hypothetical protein
MTRLSELSFEEIGLLPAGKVTDTMVARECMGLKVTELRGGDPEPYSTKVKAAAEIMWIYGIMVHSMPMPDAGGDHRYVYRALIPESFDQREDRPKARIEISASVWVDADTWPLAVVRAALMQEKMREEREERERHG